MPRASASAAAIPTVALDEPVAGALAAGGGRDCERARAPSCAESAATPGSERDGRGFTDSRGAASGDPGSSIDRSIDSVMVQLLSISGQIAWNISVADW